MASVVQHRLRAMRDRNNLAPESAEGAAAQAPGKSVARNAMTTLRVDPSLRKCLTSLYCEVMWLAAREYVTPSMARAWYTHVCAGKYSRRIRHFSGKVSEKAAKNARAVLRLEHHSRIQTTLTQLVAAHLRRRRPRPAEFIRTLLKCENVHIVTFSENYDALKSAGSYRRAGIKLVAWNRLPEARRRALWTKMLKGRVANAAMFAPRGAKSRTTRLRPRSRTRRTGGGL
jgi:hypothetical protein